LTARVMNMAALAAGVIALGLLLVAAARWIAQRPSFDFKRVDVSERRSWSVHASGPGIASTTLELGRDDPPGSVQRRFADIVAAYPMLSARVGGPPSRIDARYVNGIAAAAPSRTTDSRAR